MDIKNDIAVIIPSLEPDEKLINLVAALTDKGFTNIVIVNDGSDNTYDGIFNKTKELYFCTVLRHSINLGKGRALKTAFNYVINEMPGCKGAVTIDSDGQHGIDDMCKCIEAFTKNPKALVLGCRNFKKDNIPFRSKFGNVLTYNLIKILCGINISDTQTGLRVISIDNMKLFLTVPGERFEYEMNMLLTAKEKNIKMTEVPIETIYIADNRCSHFNPLKDSMRVYAVFAKFIFASFSSFIIDILLFTLFVRLFSGFSPKYYIWIATLMARIISAAYNFFMNKTTVFKSDTSTSASLLKYALLCVAHIIPSAFCVDIIVKLLKFNETIVKIIVDAVLFIVSFQLQREWVFKSK